jgi:hypothetical protein
VDRTLEAPYEDLPEHLHQHVMKWIYRQFSASMELTRSIALRLRIPVPDVPSNHGTAITKIMERANVDDEAALDLLEVMLESGALGPSQVAALEEFLDEGHSAYRVNDGYSGLEMRVLPEVKEQVQAVVDAAAGSPGEHLAGAYNAAYGRTPDVERAYDRSIKAAEAALRPVISSKDSKATLTKMILAIRDAPQKWEFAVVDERDDPPQNAPAAEGVQVVVDMMRLLAYGQKQRHGEDGPVEVNTEAQARAAVMIAVTLVQWATTGVLRRR